MTKRNLNFTAVEFPRQKSRHASIVNVNDTEEIYDRLRLLALCTKNKKEYKYYIRSRRDNEAPNVTFFFRADSPTATVKNY